MQNWRTTELIKRENLGENYWAQGFFYEDFGKNEYYRRDFEELRYRDLSLFTLGQIESKIILDVGCGTGLYLLTFLKLGAKYVAGQDISIEAVNIAQNICKKNSFSNFEVKAGNCEKLLFDDLMFDLVFSGDVFEHITKEEKNNFINEIFRVLKPGGKFTIKTPNKDYLRFSIFYKKICYIIKLKNPLKIHIPHTHNNPDNEHHGLTTYKELLKIFGNTMFHEPVITYQVLNKKNIPNFIIRLFKKSKYFNQHIIMTARKPYFYGLYD
jgi:ubiquinone/menaquinone biosynthesis C-methylase UbiE